MKKISFSIIWPHLLAVIIFLVVTIGFFNPVFFKNKSLLQGDIQQFLGSSKELRDYREATGEEGLWAGAMFSGMPAYLVNLDWSDGPVAWTKRVMAVFLPHPVANIFLAFISYYILLLAFRVRPFLAMAGALAFGLSSYLIVGLGAGHNNRIGAIAFMPLVMAGIHLAFSGKKILGFGITTGGLALHLRENHLQITYYLIFIVAAYGLVQLIYSTREKKLKDFSITLALLVPAALLAAGTFFGPFWAIAEYSDYSFRGKSDLVKPVGEETDGLPKSYAFEHSSALDESMTLLIPNYYGGTSANYFVTDTESKTYQALVRASDQQRSNQLAQYASAYWGPQPGTSAYYAGSIIVFLFVAGLFFAERKWIWWLLPLSMLSVVLSCGENLPSINYFLFDQFPGYNKFRSVTFALIIILFSMPLLGMMGLEKILEKGLDKRSKRKLWIAFASTAGFCLLLWMAGGFGSFMRPEEKNLESWFLNALKADRIALLRDDAFRSMMFIGGIFIVILLEVHRRLTSAGFYTFVIIMVMVDLIAVDKRYFTEDNFKRRFDETFEKSDADISILNDKSFYRVYNLNGPWTEARTSYFHHSLGGYHGAKMKRYQELYDSCLLPETRRFVNDARQGRLEFERYPVLNMLNAKYIVYGTGPGDFILNKSANGNAWFASKVEKVSNANEELMKTGEINTRIVAVISQSTFDPASVLADSLSSINLIERKPNWLKYESESRVQGLAVFSEIYYPKGWKATIDGNEAAILQADYVLRALVIPAGKHVIEFSFEPIPYVIGDKITMASNWVVILLVLGTLGWAIRKERSSAS